MNLVAVSANIDNSNKNNVKVLQNGSSVFVRVIAEKGEGKYEGSVAGVRVNLTSKNPLTVGQSFAAIVNAKNGIIQITPNENQTVNQKNIILVRQGGENLSNLMNALGIAPEPLNEHIILQMKQLGMRLDRDIFGKIRNYSLSFSGKQKKAAELITILKNKGFELSSELILQLLNLLDGDVDEENSDAEKSLKIINHKQGWLFIPYEIIENESHVVGSGIIRLLIGDDRKLSRMNLNVKFADKNFLFALEFKNRKCSCVKFNIQPCNENKIDGKIQKLKAQLKHFGIENVEWAYSDALEGTACAQETVLRIGGEI